MKVIKDFKLYEELSQFTDSMLFDSGMVIATLHTKFDGGIKVEVSLEVRGEVSVTYQGVTYHKPSEFPAELRERIQKHPGKWEYLEEDEPDLSDLSEAEMEIMESALAFDETDEPDVSVMFNNWFEYMYRITDKDGDTVRADGIMCEDDVHAMSEAELLTEMAKVASEVYEMEVA